MTLHFIFFDFELNAITASMHDIIFIAIKWNHNWSNVPKTQVFDKKL